MYAKTSFCNRKAAGSIRRMSQGEAGSTVGGGQKAGDEGAARFQGTGEGVVEAGHPRIVRLVDAEAVAGEEIVGAVGGEAPRVLADEARARPYASARRAAAARLSSSMSMPISVTPQRPR